MPDHIHFFCSPRDRETPFEGWMAYWRNIATRLWPVQSQKPIWQRDYWDRQLRQNERYQEKCEYVRMNPVRAGLVSHPEEWPHQGQLNEFQW
jgi:REP element-mobilizing transposase RayT